MIVNPIPKNDILKKLWIGECTISEYQKVTDPITHQTTNKLIAIVNKEPCRLSYSTEQVTNVDDGVPSVRQIIKLFIRPDIDIKVGSVIEVTQHNKTSKFKRASKPAIYTNHQEIVLELDEDV